jgi:hypothetical protein
MPTIRLRRNSSVQWAVLNPILLSGEQGYESDTGKHKIGDGQNRWLTLEYYIPETDIRALVDEGVAGAHDGGTTPENLFAHVHSSTPHPIYDDGPSFELLYQNAKV